MLRNRGYRLEIAAYKKDKGVQKVYVYDPWADPTLVQIGQYREGEKPDWASMYDAAMALHLDRKANDGNWGASIIAGGKIDGNSHGVFRTCGTGMEGNFTAEYFRLAY